MAFQTIQGSGGAPDSFLGTAGVDVIAIQNQADPTFLSARAADDVVTFQSFQALVTNYSLYGGQGNDSLASIATTLSSSFVAQNEGNDTIGLGAVSGSTIQGNQGNDTITLNGQATNSLVNGNQDNDTIQIAGFAASSLYGGQGRDTIFTTGALAAAVIQANQDDDTITLAPGSSFQNSTVNGNQGNDNIVVQAIAAFAGSTIFGGDGTDTINAAASNVAGVTLILSSDAGNDNVTGSGAVDTIFNTGGADTIASGAGNDSISSVDGADSITNNAGNDTIFAGAGNDTIFGGGSDVINAEAGNDTITTAAGSSTVTGGLGGDAITLGGTADVISYTLSGQTAAFTALAAINTAGSAAAFVGADVITGAAPTDLFRFLGTGALGNAYTNVVGQNVPLGNGIFDTVVTANTTNAAVVGRDNGASFVRGTWNNATQTFTNTGAGSTLLIWDTNGTLNATAFEAIVIDGVALNITAPNVTFNNSSVQIALAS